MQAAKAGATLIRGGLTAAKAIMGFNFHILVAQVANLVVRTLVGRGLSFAANAALQRFVAAAFGPVGWVIAAIGVLDIIPALVNPRAYDKYIPAVFIIGLERLAKSN